MTDGDQFPYEMCQWGRQPVRGALPCSVAAP